MSEKVEITERTDQDVLEEMESSFLDAIIPSHGKEGRVRICDMGPIEGQAIPESYRFHFNYLPCEMRKVALRNFNAMHGFYAALKDTLKLFEDELALYCQSRPALNSFQPANDWGFLSNRYRDYFARNRKRVHDRKRRLALRIAVLREKVRYLEYNFIDAESGIPRAPEPCHLCASSDIVKLVAPQDRPLCSTKGCKYVVCLLCLSKLRKQFDPTYCPGCRGKMMYRGGFPIRHDEVDPFFNYPHDLLYDHDEVESPDENSENEVAEQAGDEEIEL